MMPRQDEQYHPSEERFASFACAIRLVRALDRVAARTVVGGLGNRSAGDRGSMLGRHELGIWICRVRVARTSIMTMCLWCGDGL